ncbi:ubiquitin conjugation factor E4 A [Malaya genurostris]|uniref:ubiquitin conjugation factor E4 A n=1 Tax=Malaya genurostris TaxID=325434 RepID=UPI0026F3BCF7|nr:ubiquitin conjugation factor E4 A [Malaya genurostris]
MDNPLQQKANPVDLKINALIEKVFLITLSKDAPKASSNRPQLVYMEEVAQSSGESNLLSMELLEQALFERIILFNPSDYLLPSNVTNAYTETVAETKVILYLFGCFQRNERAINPNDSIAAETCSRMRDLILRNACTSLKQPELFEGQNLSSQLLDIFKLSEDDQPVKARFISETVKEIFADSESEQEGFLVLRKIFESVFAKIMVALRNASLISMERWIMPFLEVFTSDKSNPRLAVLFLDFTTPPEDAQGIIYSESLLGRLLSLSILPRNQNGPYEYFENPLGTNRSAYENLSSSLWNYTKMHLESMHLFIKGFLLLGGDVRSKILTWIGRCLHANAPRGQIWNTHQAQNIFGNLTTAPDSFSVNLAGLLLRLCQPLLKPQLKVLIVDPTYCAVKEPQKQAKGVHMQDTEKETCLLPVDENESRLEADKYNFVTECFFMTHKAIDLGFRVCIEKFFRMNREMHRLQSAYQDTLAGGSAGGSDVGNSIMQMLSSQAQQFLCLQNSLEEPTTDLLLLQFYEASAIWLSQLASRAADRIDGLDKAKGFAPQSIEDVKLPLTNEISKVLKCIPEYIMENIVGYLQFSRHSDSHPLRVNVEVQNSIFTMILVFMGSSERIRNPHLRARLAEGLECLLPKDTETGGFCFSAALFSNHPHRLEIIPNLLRVFVSIEMTGQSVQFEQKFNYRRPMYAIMDYLWKLDEQKQCFRELEREAIRDIEAEDPPIFLRFINLLINDAIFLLDESLSNLQQIRQLQAAQDAGEWTNLPANERQQNVVNLRHLGLLARFDNILGRDTINILQLLTSETKEIFCHSSMVDRVSAMLNYFLLNLTGPKKSNFKVKDKREFEFDPANTVLEICRIYVNLQGCDAFCLAVSQDGRSYSPQLFEYAEQVLTRIGGGQLIGEMQELSARVQQLEAQQKIDEEALVDPPDEFLDPIMSSLMSDPVVLPSSRNTVDRSTIARHLLSDQSDPFNRSPLTMDQVKRNDELKARIDEWIREKRAAHAAKMNTSE